MLVSDILKFTKTTSEREELISDIDKLLNSLYQKSGSFEKALDLINIKIAQMVREAFCKNGSLFNKEMVVDFLTQLKDKAQAMTKISIALAFSPSGKTIENISEWVNKNIGNSYVLDLVKDETIIGGAMISFEGRYIDLSLKKTLDEVFTARRKEIASLLNS